MTQSTEKFYAALGLVVVLGVPFLAVFAYNAPAWLLLIVACGFLMLTVAGKKSKGQS